MEQSRIMVTCCKPDEHGQKHVKPVESMAICARGIKYCMELVKSGEMLAESCELCIITWLCDDPIETCMNPEDTIQWYTQCTRPVEYWVEHIESVLNKPQWVANMGDHMWALELVKSIWDCIETLGITVKLVK